MKIKIFLIVCLFTLFSCKQQNSSKAKQDPSLNNSHNSRNSLDFKGAYKGIIPCANCDGIEIELILFKDNTFKRTIQYLVSGRKLSNC
jgi:uncharacterized lipoprotein NlpE involved in copper resistance